VHRCPLCHTNLGTSDDVWKEHLMASNNGAGCPKNTRTSAHAKNGTPPTGASNSPANKK
jgi:hypothetical protein